MLWKVITAAVGFSAFVCGSTTQEAKAGVALGSSVTAAYYFNGFPVTPATTETISPTADFILDQDLIATTVSTTQVNLSYSGSVPDFTPAMFNGPQFDFINSGGAITSVTLDPSTNFPGASFSASDLSLTTDGTGGQLLDINFEGQPINGGFNVTVDLNSAETPEPTTLTMTGLGIAALVIARRWQRKSAPAVSQHLEATFILTKGE